MRLAKKALAIALTTLLSLVALTAQTPRSAEDSRNLAPTVGTGGPVGGPTGLFTVYDGQTLRKGEYTFSAAYSNYDRDPGNVDITSIPLSFQIGLSDHLELFFETEGYRAVKVNSPRNLSGFYLPNSQFNFNGVATSAPAIVLAPQGAGTSQFPGAIFRPQGNQPFVQFPFVGGVAGNFGLFFPSGPVFGFPTGTFPTLGAPRAGGNGADLFPGVGSIYGGILPGIVLSTVCTAPTAAQCNNQTQAPVVFTTAPSYLPDAPFINRTFGESAFNSFTGGAKFRFTGVNNPIGVGLLAYYRWYADKATDFSGFNQLQRGASPGGNRGDIGVVLFADARLRKWVNVSGNLGFNYNSDVKGDFPSGRFTLLDRPNEVLAGIGVDFPVNKYFQPIFEVRSLQYVGGRTPNAFENSPIDALAGFRIFPKRWFGFGAAYRYHANEQDKESFGNGGNANIAVTGRTVTSNNSLFTSGVPTGFAPSEDPHGYILQAWIGRRNSRGVPPVENQHANVNDVTFDKTTVTAPCPPGTQSKSGACSDDMNVRVSTSASDPDNDVLTYNYTVSSGRIVGTGANVSWDLSGVKAGTYTITAGVDDGCGVCGKTVTKTIEVTTCVDCVQPCNCPTISVSGPSGDTEPGQTMTFTANVSGGSQDSVTYNWSVSAGNIESGQGTPTITVMATEVLRGQSVTATVEIGGLCGDCQRSSSASGSVPLKTTVDARRIDEFGPLQNDDIKARIDNLVIELQNDPSATATVINWGTPAQIRARERVMRTRLTEKGVDLSRVNFVNGGAGSGVETELYIVPTGAAQPTGNPGIGQ